jgi:hypothetical protein
VPQAEHEQLTRDVEHLRDQFENGEVSENDYKVWTVAFGAEMAGDDPDTTANDVAVFIVDRPRGTDDLQGTSRS